MATQLEDGNVSDAETALRQAQDALRQALERGASDEEIKKLTEDLRAAMDKFLQALAEEMRKNPQQNARRMDPNSRMLRPQDFKSMLDRLEQLSRSGAQGCRAPVARPASADAGKPADGAARRRHGRWRRRHDVGARSARRHDPQAAAVARPHVPAGPGSAASARPAPGQRGQRGRMASRASRATANSANCSRTSRRCAIS